MFIHRRPRAAAARSRPKKTNRPTVPTGSSWTTTTATPSPALWNYAQHYALNDNSYGNQFGPSTPGAINLISGDTEGAGRRFGANGEHRRRRAAGRRRTALRPVQRTRRTPAGKRRRRRRQKPSACRAATTAEMTGKNIGDLLNERGVTWGWFQGGFEPTSHEAGTNRPDLRSDDAEHRRSNIPDQLRDAPRAVRVLQEHGQRRARRPAFGRAKSGTAIRPARCRKDGFTTNTTSNGSRKPSTPATCRRCLVP